MKALVSVITIFFLVTGICNAETNPIGNVEKIDLNLKEHEMAVTFLGAENGGATIIQTFNGENVLAYSGGDLMVLEKWLTLYKVKEIGKLIITSENALSYDLEELIKKFQIKEVIAPTKLTLMFNKDLELDKQIVITSWQEGTKKTILPEITAEVQFAGTEKDEGLDFTLFFFKHRLFLMNSFSERAEEKLLSKNFGEVNVFRVPNSAKDDFLSEKLIEHINPQVSILYQNDRAHEGKELVDDLYNAWSEVYFTKQNGTVTIKFTEANYEVFTIPPDENK